VLSNPVEGIVYDDENMTVGEYLGVWLKGSVRGSIRQSTYDRDAYLVENHVKPALGRIKLKNLSSAHVQGFSARPQVARRRPGERHRKRQAHADALWRTLHSGGTKVEEEPPLHTPNAAGSECPRASALVHTDARRQ
jgi:Phage integrase, N-terminal SAM-like domain